jgi:hypothetical protein
VACGFAALKDELSVKVDENRAASHRRAMDLIATAGDRGFERECKHAGIPDSPVSPSLLKRLGVSMKQADAAE